MSLFHAPSAAPALLLALALSLPSAAEAARQAVPAPEPQVKTMFIVNRSHNDLVALRVCDGASARYGRVDLGPGSEDQIENPGGVAEIRADLGLSLCVWKDVPLNGVISLTLCPEHEGCFIALTQDTRERHLRGSCQSLLPGPNALPACSLEGFRAGMRMKDACGLLGEYENIEDDIFLATLGFANIVWSARLTADMSESGPVAEARLESVELRQKLSQPNLNAVYAALRARDYVPWQANFPGMEINFTEMESYPPETRDELLRLSVASFLKHGRGTASVILAPASVVRELAATDYPKSDTQLYTISMHRDSDTLVLDLTAYTAEELER